MNKPTLIYFAARGRAELIRFVLAQAGVDYQEHLIGKGGPPSNGRPTDFAELKKSGLLPFEAAPVWEDADGFRLAQSSAIAMYLARQHDLVGKDVREQARVEEILGGLDDARQELRKLHSAAAEQRPAVRAELISTTLPRWLGFLNRILLANHGGNGFLVGETLTIADLGLYVLIEVLRDNQLDAGLETMPQLRAFSDRIAKQPRIAAYLASPSRHPVMRLPG